MAKIKEGYYWVKIDNEWTPAEYDGDMWYIILLIIVIYSTKNKITSTRC